MVAEQPAAATAALPAIICAAPHCPRGGAPFTPRTARQRFCDDHCRFDAFRHNMQVTPHKCRCGVMHVADEKSVLDALEMLALEWHDRDDVIRTGAIFDFIQRRRELLKL